MQLKNQVHTNNKQYLFGRCKEGLPDHLQVVDFHKKTYITGKDENVGLVVFYDVVSRVSWFGCQNRIRLLHSSSVVRFLGPGPSSPSSFRNALKPFIFG